MLVGKPIMTGESDSHQLDLIWDLMGSPSDDNMPGWKQLPGGEHLNPRPRPGNLQNRFREQVRLYWSKYVQVLTMVDLALALFPY